MIYNFKRLNIIFLLLLVVFHVGDLRAEGTKSLEVVAVMPGDFPPQYSLDQNGRPSGFAVEVMNRVAELAGLKVSYKVVSSWEEVHETFKAGQADIIPNMGITARREAFAVFSHPVETFPVSIFVRNDDYDLKNSDSLTGHKVGVIKVNVGYALLKDKPGFNLVVMEHVSDLIFELLSGRVDAIVYPEPVIWLMARESRVDHRIKVVGEPLIEIKRGMAVAKGNTVLLNRLNAALDSFVASDDYKDIYTKWYGRPTPYWTAKRIGLVMGVLLAVIMVLMFVWRFVSLRKANIALWENVRERIEVQRELAEHREKLEETVAQRTQELLKANLSLEKKTEERQKLIVDLQQALAEVKTLQGFLPICANCKKIRDDQGYWNQIELYIHKHLDTEFTHSICPDCIKKLYPELKSGLLDDKKK